MAASKLPGVMLAVHEFIPEGQVQLLFPPKLMNVIWSLKLGARVLG